MDVEWLKSKKAELGLKDGDLALPMGVERSVANKIANGKVALNARRADAVAKALGVSRDEVLFRFGISAEQPSPKTPAVLQVPENDDIKTVGIQHIDLAFGLGATFADSPVEVQVLQFPQEWVQTITLSPAELLTWTRGRGDSMLPTIDDGDLVLLDRSQREVKEQDALWAYTIGDIAAIKRLRVKGDRYQIFSDNPAVAPDEEPIDFVNIVARVVFVGKRL
ncbi:LexA family transcriptional regulator [Sphingomonas sp. ACRSK]|uniref:LexA family transcriptional regulator n=1 Tax=Sphingomonas sp. ACRSK TaxID=2918213 RepID=UPI001EF4F5F2|nr:XRE family transcriptional regulator [Sphingomonas sp. ACRSK]MCG7348202.1 helix-turn-helix domain-containing protein [Sphingomonas sp. ACRSK]